MYLATTKAHEVTTNGSFAAYRDRATHDVT